MNLGVMRCPQIARNVEPAASLSLSHCQFFGLTQTHSLALDCAWLQFLAIYSVAGLALSAPSHLVLLQLRGVRCLAPGANGSHRTHDAHDNPRLESHRLLHWLGDHHWRLRLNRTLPARGTARGLGEVPSLRPDSRLGLALLAACAASRAAIDSHARSADDSRRAQHAHDRRVSAFVQHSSHGSD